VESGNGVSQLASFGAMPRMLGGVASPRSGGCKDGMKWYRTIEFALIAVGLMLIALYVAVRAHSVISSRAAVRAFRAAQEAKADRPNNASGSIKLPTKVDFNLWSVKRITAYEQSLTQHSGTPLAVLRIPKLQLEVPVFDGTDDLTLNRGVGRIRGMARPGEKGNVGIAGHRDGFFRGLKDVSVGDSIDMDLPDGTTRYVVDRIQIVGPDNVHALRDRHVPSLTLVTCYPFYFIGDAPQRYVVQASVIDDGFNANARNQPNSVIRKFH
jgi:sortase A